jgi:signal transduction histidine kinase
MESRLQALGVELLMDVISLQSYVSPNDQFNLDVYRILQEATTNAVERADSKVLRIASHNDMAVHIVTIENADGRPLAIGDNEQALRGSGINNMASRARRHNGEFTINSTPTGARVTLQLP